MKRVYQVQQQSKFLPSKWMLYVSVCVIFALTACKSKEEVAVEEPIRPVKTITVKVGSGAGGLKLPGKVRATQRVELAFRQVSGRLIELPIAGREGENVTQGELLAKIDPTDFEVAIRNVEGRLKEAQASLKLAEANLKRVRRIQQKDPGAVSVAEIDKNLEASNRAKGRIRSLRAELDDAQNRLGYTELKAPFDGIIARRFVDNYQRIQAGEPIVSLQDISNVELLLDVPESAMARARDEGKDAVKAVAVFPTAPDKQFPLTLKEAATDADPATQTYQVVMEMPQPDGLNVFPGMTATVSVSAPGLGDVSDAITIPAIAVLADPSDQWYVWVVDSEKMAVQRRDLKVGEIEGSQDILVTEGLKDGEIVVVAGGVKLKEGMQVRMWDAK
jgi:RND family efflux transporter MFP subunit